MSETEEKMVWLPASTMEEDAPKDCEYFLICRKSTKIGEFGSIGLARYVPDYKNCVWVLQTNGEFRGPPEFWMRIPNFQTDPTR